MESLRTQPLDSGARLSSNLGPIIIRCVILDKLLIISQPQVPNPQNEDNYSTYLIRCL